MLSITSFKSEKAYNYTSYRLCILIVRTAYKMTAVLKYAGVMHLTYYVNRLTTTKVDSTYLAVNQQCITYNVL